MDTVAPSMKSFVEMATGLFEHGGLAEWQGMPLEVRTVVVQGIEQFPRANFAKMGQHFLDGREVHPRTLTDAAHRLMVEGECKDGGSTERDAWDSAQTYVRRLERLREAMLALQEATVAFDEQAEALVLSSDDRAALFDTAIRRPACATS